MGEVNGKVGRRTRMLDDTTRIAKIVIYIEETEGRDEGALVGRWIYRRRAWNERKR